MFIPESVALPDLWPACRAGRCGSRAAWARIDGPFEPVTLVCENGHFRGYRKRDEFRGRGRYAGLFSDGALPALTRGAEERKLEAAPRRCEDVLEDADCCALCGTTPVRHPLREEEPELSDRDLWSWLQRWRVDVYTQLLEALAIVRRREHVTYGNWRMKLPAALREIVVRALDDSALLTAHLIPLDRLAPRLGALSARDLDLAVHRLLFAVCRRCSERRAVLGFARAQLIADYVAAAYGGDERRARASAFWPAFERLLDAAGTPHAGARTA